tara:strand:- start:956 stop:1579 length:624 start_codon:yes stop_codon:yes gene_type:complete
MKKAIVNSKLFLMGICAVIIISCSPENGDDGAMGPQGEPGITGQNGADGKDGAIDIKYTPWFNFEDTTTRNDFFYLSSKTFSFYDQSFIDNGGAVLVYEGYVYTGTLSQVPIRPTNIISLMRRDSNNGFEWEVDYRMEPSSIDLTIDVLSGSTASYTRERWLKDVFYVKNIFFRIIFIPGGTPISAKKEAVDFNDYEAVKKYYNIPD